MNQPTIGKVTIRAVETAPEFAMMLYQRWLVLRKPLGMPQGTEFDRYDHLQHDHRVVHLIAIDIRSQSIVGSIRLRELSPTLGGIAYVVVMPEFQNQGVGSALMQHVILIAKQQAYSQLRVMSRRSAIGFYQRFGFAERGESIHYLDTPHMFMYLDL
ncbi:MAG: GNAT family N-acetyltransferase [Elainella sp. Prado103]|jgi:ribosomal protein S18 acetylase RimI-like enzyme|nr:GNAT family N-acetyltransferase [Elainella sp. Prado103]